MNTIFDFSNLTFGGRFAMVLLISGALGVFGLWILRGLCRIGLHIYEAVKGPVKNPVIKSLRKIGNDTLFIITIPFAIFCTGVGMTLIVGWLQI